MLSLKDRFRWWENTLLSQTAQLNFRFEIRRSILPWHIWWRDRMWGSSPKMRFSFGSEDNALNWEKDYSKLDQMQLFKLSNSLLYNTSLSGLFYCWFCRVSISVCSSRRRSTGAGVILKKENQYVNQWKALIAPPLLSIIYRLGKGRQWVIMERLKYRYIIIKKVKIDRQFKIIRFIWLDISGGSLVGS